FNVSATDPDAGQSLTYSLTSPPSGASIDPATGVFSWTPAEAQGPGNYTITVNATDNGTPALSGSRSFNVVVDDVNSPPSLAPIADAGIAASSSLPFTASASDSDVPANSLTFSLDAGAPAGATIGASSGFFSWTPDATQGLG